MEKNFTNTVNNINVEDGFMEKEFNDLFFEADTDIPEFDPNKPVSEMAGEIILLKAVNYPVLVNKTFVVTASASSLKRIIPYLEDDTYLLNPEISRKVLSRNLVAKVIQRCIKEYESMGEEQKKKAEDLGTIKEALKSYSKRNLWLVVKKYDYGFNTIKKFQEALLRNRPRKIIKLEELFKGEYAIDEGLDFDF